MAYTLKLTDAGVVVSAVLTDAHDNVVPSPDSTPVWTESSDGAVLAPISSDTSSATYGPAAAGSSTVTYTETNNDGTVVTGTFDVVVVDEPTQVVLSGALYVAPAAPAEVPVAEPVVEAPVAPAEAELPAA